jgi:flagellar biosynthesis/type III secretory pathway chaperone
LGFRPGLKGCVGGLSNGRSCFVTLLSSEQQKITQNRKLSKHIQSILQAKEIIIGLATLFVIYRTQKNPITTTKFTINNTTY